VERHWVGSSARCCAFITYRFVVMVDGSIGIARFARIAEDRSMERLLNVLVMRFWPIRPDYGLVVLRVWTAVTLLMRHGWEKRPGQWDHMLHGFPDPIGIGSYASFVIAFMADFVGSLLLVVGLGTRWIALYCFFNTLVAWAFVHHFVFFGITQESDHGELIVLYLGSFLTLMVAGGGKASLDRLLTRASPPSNALAFMHS